MSVGSAVFQLGTMHWLTVPRLTREAEIEGFFTNHSLRATATTRLYDAQVDEAMIMQRTEHRSVNGVHTREEVKNSAS